MHEHGNMADGKCKTSGCVKREKVGGVTTLLLHVEKSEYLSLFVKTTPTDSVNFFICLKALCIPPRIYADFKQVFRTTRTRTRFF